MLIFNKVRNLYNLNDNNNNICIFNMFVKYCLKIGQKNIFKTVNTFRNNPSDFLLLYLNHPVHNILCVYQLSCHLNKIYLFFYLNIPLKYTFLPIVR